MKRKAFLFMLTAATMMALSSCKNDKPRQAEGPGNDDMEMADKSLEDEEDGQADALRERGDFTFKTRIIMSEPDEEDDQVVERIVVLIKPRGGKTITTETQGVQPLDTINWQGFGRIHEDDINFDGYPDLMVCEGPVNTYGNFTYTAWLWNQEEHQFKLAEGFNKICDPELHPKEKTITGGFRMDDHEYDEVWEWIDGKITKTKSDLVVYSEMNEEEDEE